MKNKSWRHHYLPIFYLKRFTNDSGLFKIFDVQKDHFLKEGKFFSPRSHFFERNANTFLGEDGESSTDFLETSFYAKIDQQISRLLDIIDSSNSTSRYGVDENDMPILQHFINVMYWRLPHRKIDIEYLLRCNDLNAFGITLKNKDESTDEKTKELENKLKNNPEFRKGLRYAFASADTARFTNCNTPLTIQPTPGEPFLCSDNPVLFEKKLFPKIYEDDFIFPLTGSKLFIRANRTSGYHYMFKIWVDILIYKQAVKYVSCTDEKYIDILEEHLNKHFQNVDELRSTVFDIIKKAE